MRQADLLFKKMVGIVTFHLRFSGAKVYFHSVLSPKDAMGLYEDGKIFIDSTMPLSVQYCTLIHERRHFLCDSKGCFCFKYETDFWCEYHAFSDEMFEWLDIFPFKLVLSLGRTCLRNYSSQKWLAHLCAIRKVYRWKRVKDAAAQAHQLRAYKKLLSGFDRAVIKVKPHRIPRK